MNVRLWFPEWLVPNMENRAYLESVHDKLPGYQLAVEFRNKLWNSDSSSWPWWRRCGAA
jgi:uncharacterized protein YecE (DUF72 family)